MKIKVEHEDGRSVTITLTDDVKIVEEDRFDHIVTAGGTEYFFTKDGYYIGWASTAPYSQRAQDTTEEVEAGRKDRLVVVRVWTSRIQ
jgi:hypothetical protein